MKVKICGLMSMEDVNLANKYKPDFVGFIFFPPSHRYISYETAREFRENLNGNIPAVGVFVDVDPKEILKNYEMGTFDIAQLHGKESQEDIDFLKRSGVPVIKAVKIKDENSLDEVKTYAPDYFLFDVFDKKKVGGTGESFNWALLDKYKGNIPFFLAGGIDLNNVDTALKQNAFALDISSGAETEKRKDPIKVKELIKKVREQV